MLLDKLKEIENKYDELTKILSDPEIFSDYLKSQKYSKEQAEIEEVVRKIREYKGILSGINEAEEILSADGDDGLKELAIVELEVVVNDRDPARHGQLGLEA
ncbi:MAG: PCRF domain-containing protein [Thermodesulfovibrionia bacterium]|nr:PCRF domain-containing protein [Thermodesulfovibrionia bacterium]